MKKQPTTSPRQIIITGMDIVPTTVGAINNYLRTSLFPAPGFCHDHGGIGYIDSGDRELTVKELSLELEELARRFPILELGVSLMSGAPGSYNLPVAGFLVKGGVVKRSQMPHLGHKPPQRNKSKG